ncbi:MAG: methionine gamma-lyase family protein, partial [Clostridia bacterium]|nr:methionine gamma-lyase family protein [Clostridia bacterium]
MKELKQMYESLGVSREVYEYGEMILSGLKDRFEAINQMAEYNQAKVLHAMQENRVDATCVAATTGYGYDDLGRDKLEKVYA